MTAMSFISDSAGSRRLRHKTAAAYEIDLADLAALPTRSARCSEVSILGEEGPRNYHGKVEESMEIRAVGGQD
jgi:hypothetical protein